MEYFVLRNFNRLFLPSWSALLQPIYSEAISLASYTFDHDGNKMNAAFWPNE